MKAIQVNQFGGPEVLEYTEVATPTPQAGEVQVRVHAAGINPVDTYIRSGSYALKPQLPFIPGMDASGVVTELGEGVNGIAVGDRVYTAATVTGASADYLCCATDKVHPLPSRCSFAQGASLGVPAATAWRALFQKGQAKSGQRLLVHGGSGSVGLACVQLALAEGLDVYATAGSEAGRAQLERLGVAGVADHHDASQVDELAEQAGGFDLVIEMLANHNLQQDLKMVARGGRVVVVGNRGQVEIDPRLLMQKEAQLTGVMLFAASDDELAEIHRGLYQAVESGNFAPVVGQTFELEELAQAHEAVMQPHVGKLVVMTAAGRSETP